MGDTFAMRKVVGGMVAGLAFVAYAGCSRSEASPSQRSEKAVEPATPSAALELATNKVEGKNFKLEAAPQGECKALAECRVTIKLEAVGEYHINKEYPYKFKADANGDVEFLGKDDAGKNVFSKSAGDFKTEGEQKAVMTVRFKPSKAGQVVLGGTYKLSVCSAQNCQLESQQLAVNVPVK